MIANIVAESYKHVAQTHIHTPFLPRKKYGFKQFVFKGNPHILIGQSKSSLHLLRYAVMKKENKRMLQK